MDRRDYIDCKVFASDLRSYASDKRRNEFVRAKFYEAANIISLLLEDAERRFTVLDATKMLKRMTYRDSDGNPHFKDSVEVGWINPLNRLALLEDIIEEARR